MPFGCKAFAMKPRTALSKTRMESRAWIGINLGLSSQSPGAYHVFVPAGIPPQPAGTDQQHGLAEATDAPSTHDLRTADHVLDAAAQSRRTPLLFSGPLQRPDGIAAFLNGYGLECDSIDNHR
eukprot:555956-Pleurochrysis_carterae.AAC.1